MKSYKVGELMVPLSDYATVKKGSTIYEAIIALEESRKMIKEGRYPHMAVLVLDEHKKVIGKIGLFDVLHSLEPKYSQILSGRQTTRFGFSTNFLKNLQEQYSIWEGTMKNICIRASDVKVEDFMYTPLETEYIHINDSLDRAIHQLVMERHFSLLVKDPNDIVGILKLSDVVSIVFKAIKECKIGS